MTATGMDYGNKALASVYEIERTVEIHLTGGKTFRLEVARCVKGTADVHYVVWYYEQHTRHIALNGTISAESVPHSTPYCIWVPDNHLPWVNQPSADLALSQAIDWLAERRSN